MQRKIIAVVILALAPMSALALDARSALACWNCVGTTCDNTNPFGGGTSCVVTSGRQGLECHTFGTCTGI